MRNSVRAIYWALVLLFGLGLTGYLFGTKYFGPAELVSWRLSLAL